MRQARNKTVKDPGESLLAGGLDRKYTRPRFEAHDRSSLDAVLICVRVGDKDVAVFRLETDAGHADFTQMVR